jgi:ribosomal protein L32
LLSAIVRLLIRWFPILGADHPWRVERRYIKAHRIPPVQRCQGCGNRVRVDMKVNPYQNQVVCQCPLCLTAWGYNPFQKLNSWAKLPTIEE